jgi:hypothetical protein
MTRLSINEKSKISSRSAWSISNERFATIGLRLLRANPGSDKNLASCSAPQQINIFRCWQRFITLTCESLELHRKLSWNRLISSIACPTVRSNATFFMAYLTDISIVLRWHRRPVCLSRVAMLSCEVE